MADKIAPDVVTAAKLITVLQAIPPETKVVLETNEGILNIIASEYEGEVLILVAEGY